MMKPRIVFVRSGDFWFWRCRSVQGSDGMGATPAEAYRSWKSAQLEDSARKLREALPKLPPLPVYYHPSGQPIWLAPTYPQWPKFNPNLVPLITCEVH